MNPFFNLFQLVKEMVGTPINNALRDSQLINNVLSSLNAILRGLFKDQNNTTYISQFAIGDIISIIILVLIIKMIINLFLEVFLIFKEIMEDPFNVKENKRKITRKKRKKAFK